MQGTQIPIAAECGRERGEGACVRGIEGVEIHDMRMVLHNRPISVRNELQRVHQENVRIFRDSIQPDGSPMQIADTVYPVRFVKGKSPALRRHAKGLVAEQEWEAEGAEELAHQGDPAQLASGTAHPACKPELGREGAQVVHEG
jgi:hypothetical protein